MTPDGMFAVHGAGRGRDSVAYLDHETAARAAVMVWYVEKEGGTLFMTEGYRPVGVESDQHVRRSQDTTSGMSTQWYQWGRYQRGETPSAAWPGTSRHGEGRALDSNAPTQRDMELRATGAAWAGLVFNVPSESWHCEPLGTPLVDLTPWYQHVRQPADDGFTDADRELLDALASGRLPTARGYVFPARDAVQNNLEAVAGLLREVAGSRVDTTELAEQVAAHLLPTLAGRSDAAAVADELARRLTET